MSFHKSRSDEGISPPLHYNTFCFWLSSLLVHVVCLCLNLLSKLLCISENCVGKGLQNKKSEMICDIASNTRYCNINGKAKTVSCGVRTDYILMVSSVDHFLVPFRVELEIR